MTKFLLTALFLVAAALTWAWLRGHRAAKQLAEEKARAKTRLIVESEAKRRAEDRRLAQEKTKAEPEAQDNARMAAETETKRLAEEKRRTEETAETEAKRLAEVEAKIE